jgi:hypothetical protein
MAKANTTATAVSLPLRRFPLRRFPSTPYATAHIAKQERRKPLRQSLNTVLSQSQGFPKQFQLKLKMSYTAVTE